MKGFLDWNDDEIERQRLIDDLFANIGFVPDLEGFPASEWVESSNNEDDSASEADTESHDEIQTVVWTMRMQQQRTRPTLICQWQKLTSTMTRWLMH